MTFSKIRETFGRFPVQSFITLKEKETTFAVSVSDKKIFLLEKYLKRSDKVRKIEFSFFFESFVNFLKN